MKYGILFSGQGAQFEEMGLDFYQNSPLFKEYIDKASEITSYDLREIFANQDNQLSQTKYVQPAIVAMSVGIYKMLSQALGNQFEVGGMVGLSLGEYSALMASGKLNYQDGMAALKDRAIYMQEDADENPSMMGAAMNPDIEKLEAICAEIADVTIANYNTPKQVVLGGTTTGVKEAMAAIENQGAAKRVVPLKVSGAFHTPLFINSSQKMGKRLENITFENTDTQVISNTTVKPFETEKIAQILEAQIVNPTHFGDCLQYLIDNENINATLEIGPGQTLTKFAKQVDKSLDRHHISSLEDFEKFIEFMKEK